MRGIIGLLVICSPIIGVFIWVGFYCAWWLPLAIIGGIAVIAGTTFLGGYIMEG